MCYDGTYPFSDLINFLIQKIAILIEMLIFELAFSHHFIREFTLQIHEEFQHLIVRFATEQYFARVQFVDGATGRPHINAIIILHA